MFGLGEALFGLAHAVFILRAPLLETDRGLVQLSLPVLELLQVLGVGRLGGVDLPLGGVELRVAVLQRGLAALKLGAAGRKLLSPGGDLGLLRGEFRLRGGVALPRLGERGVFLPKPRLQRGDQQLAARRVLRGGYGILQQGDLSAEGGDLLGIGRQHGGLVGIQRDRAHLQFLFRGLQLRAAGLQLGLLLVEQRAVLLDLPPRGGELRHAVVELFAAVVELLLSLCELFFTVLELLARRGELFFRLRALVPVFLPGLVQLAPAVGKLLVRFGAQLVQARRAETVPQRPDAPLDVRARVVVFLGIDPARQVAEEQQLVIGLAVEGLRNEQHEALDPARAERGVAAIGADIAGRTGQAHDRKAAAREKRARVGVVFLSERDRRADVGRGKDAVVAQALPRAAGHASRRQLGDVDALGDAHEAADRPRPAVLDVGVGEKSALRRGDAVRLLKGSAVALGKAEGGEQLKIMEMLLAPIVVGRAAHRGEGAFQPGEKADAEGDDPEDGEIASQTVPDAPQQHFESAAVHRLTIPVPPPASRSPAAPRRGCCRFSRG